MTIKVISAIVAGIVLLTGCASKNLQTNQDGNNNNNNQQTTKAGLNPVAAQYNIQLGLGYMAQGDMQRAKTKLLLALQQAPNTAETNDAMAFFHERVGDNKQAKQYFLRALQVEPDKGAPLNNYGTFLCRQGQYAEADSYFLAAVKDPDYVNAAEAYENAGICASAIPNLAKAQHYFLRALQQDPRRATSILELGSIAFKEKHYDVAQNYLAAYQKIAPQTARSLWLSYRLAKQQGNRTQQNEFASRLKSQFSSSREYKLFTQSN